MRSNNNVSELMLSCQYGFVNKPMYPVCVSLYYDCHGSMKIISVAGSRTSYISNAGNQLKEHIKCCKLFTELNL
jgi:hypothetical protein